MSDGRRRDDGRRHCDVARDVFVVLLVYGRLRPPGRAQAPLRGWLGGPGFVVWPVRLRRAAVTAGAARRGPRATAPLPPGDRVRRSDTSWDTHRARPRSPARYRVGGARLDQAPHLGAGVAHAPHPGAGAAPRLRRRVATSL